MKKIWNSQPKADYTYRFTPQNGARLTLPERLFQWLFYFDGGQADERGEYAEYEDHTNPPEETRQLIGMSRRMGVQQALNDWKAASAYFESVSDPELVDYAVYEMEAAQKRYIYLLRNAKDTKQRRMR